MNKLLVVVDMQNDFITDALANTEGQKIVPDIAEYIRQFDGDIVCTLDTHSENYLEIQEGRKLPVKHCIKDTEGWRIVPELMKAVNEKKERVTFIEKKTFGSTDLGRKVECGGYDSIFLCGVCTDICVISNAMVIKAYNPEIEINVLGGLCAGVTPESHRTALNAMEACQINII